MSDCCKKGKKKFNWKIPAASIAVILLVAVVFASNTSAEHDALVYKTPDCGCCDIHASYMQGDFNVETKDITQREMYNLKEDKGIPSDVYSCHTSIIEGYIVEGHMPMEVIEKLLEEQPDIVGIALPDMPSGSPGMPGQKTEEWTIYAINEDGSYEEYMRL